MFSALKILPVLFIVAFLLIFPDSSYAQTGALNISCSNNQAVLSASWDLGTGQNCQVILREQTSSGQTSHVLLSPQCKNDSFISTFGEYSNARDPANPNKITITKDNNYLLQLYDSQGTKVVETSPTTAACSASSSSTSTTTTAGRAPQTPSQSNWDAFNQTTFSFNGIINASSCLGIGYPFGGNGCPETVFSDKGVATKILSNGEGGGALGASNRFMALMNDNPPASGVQYLARNIQSGFGLTDTAYAQVGGTGASVIQPVERIWEFSRNFAYLAFTLVFVVAGFMIMFRRKLNPQTVIGLQMALPGLIIGLIIVTFSYFIAGLIIDLGFLATQMAGVLFVSQLGQLTLNVGQNTLPNTPPNALSAINELLNSQNILTMFTSFVFTGNLLQSAASVGTSVADIIYQNTGNRAILGVIGALAACLPFAVPIAAGFGAGILPGLGGIALCAGAGGASGAAGGGVIISGAIYLILLFGLLQAMFRLLFTLIGTYVTIILTTIFGPFIILFSALPGQGGMMALWWRSLLANVLVFPAVFIVFLLIATILGVGGSWNLDSGAVGEFRQALPLFGGSPVGFIRALVAYGLLMILPGVPDFVRDMLKARPNQILANAQAQTVRGGVGPAVAGGGLVVQAGAPLWRFISRRW